ncbi:MAG: epoxyqueuosine reductase [Deltaproteobacteria bacterium]|jgi:epoxyqueuosine reductase|nr:epoxyqueuosine reductase [Deltaproteobacteria bacterium]
MSKNRLAEGIQSQALALGFEKLALIPLPRLNGFGSEVDRRLDALPEGQAKSVDKAVFERFAAFRRLSEVYPWAKTAIIAVMNYGVYRIPSNLIGKIGRVFCVDCRKDAQSQGYKASLALEEFMIANGLRVETERKYGLLPLRWAAYRAGLGRGRKNNFFYTQSGSWIHLEAWLGDQELELTENVELKPCPKDCDLCLKACPTGALAEPYLTRPSLCLTFLNATRPSDWVNHPLAKAAGEWIYGCDMCQGACPFNRNKWREDEEFPGLAELSQNLGLGQIVDLDYAWIRANLAPKFWYAPPENAFQWKVNALNALKNSWPPSEWRLYAQRALKDESPEVRRMAAWVLSLAD